MSLRSRSKKMGYGIRAKYLALQMFFMFLISVHAVFIRSLWDFSLLESYFASYLSMQVERYQAIFCEDRAEQLNRIHYYLCLVILRAKRGDRGPVDNDNG